MGARDREIIALLMLVLQVLPILAIRLGDCKDHEYLLNGDTQCRTCDPCPAGEMYTVHCGYQQDHHGNIKKPGLPCEPCPQDTYKSEKSRSLCRDCKLECASNRVVVHQCNATHNLKCSQCKKGFYTEYDGSCMPCMPCYGDVLNDEYKKQFVKQECVDAGMGMKSCRKGVKRSMKTTCKQSCSLKSEKKQEKVIKIRYRCRRLKRCKKRCLSSKRFTKKTRHVDVQWRNAFAVKTLSFRQLRKLLSKHQRNVLILLVKLQLATHKRKKTNKH